MKQVITKRNLARAAMTLLVMLCSLTGSRAQSELTVYADGEATCAYVPVYGYYADYYQKCEFVIPQGELTAMAGSAILDMTFYLYSSAEAAWGGNFQVFMKEVSETAISAYYGMDGATVVFEGPLDGTQSTMTIDFDVPYNYNGGNLLIGVYQTVPGSYKSAYFYGVEVAGASIQGYSSGSLNDVAANQKDFLPKTTFTYGAAPTVAKPKNVTVNYTGGLTAEVTWTSDASLFDIDVNGTVTENITANPYTLTGLDYGTLYTVKVRAKKGEDVSFWSSPVSFNTDISDNMCSITLVLTDSYGDGWNGNAIKIVDVLTDMEIGTYANQDLDDKRGEEVNTITAPVPDDRDIRFEWVSGNFTDECSYVVYDVNGEVIFEGSGAGLSEPVTYHVNCTVSPWHKPTNLAASEIGPSSAVLSWTENSDPAATAWVVAYKADGAADFTEVDNVTANPYTLEGLTPETEYTVKVRPATDEDEKWSDEITFITAVAFPAPTAVAANNVTAATADISWTGNDDATSYNLRYRTALGDVVFLENFEGVENNALPDGWTTIDADGDWQNWYTFTPTNTIDDNGNPYVFDATCATSASYIGSGPLTPDNWLITPKLDLQGTMSIWLRGQDPDYAKEHFAIYLSTSGNSVADFTTTLVPETEATGVYVEYNADLSAFEGQQGYIAIRHFNCTDMYRLNVDNFTITNWTYGEWVTVNNATSPYSLTGLAENSMYQVQVQAVYAEGESTWAAANFTTLEKVPTPADLAASEIKARTAVLSWTENGEATAWEICLNDDEENLIAADSNPFTLTDLTPGTDYTAKVRAIGEDNEKSKWSAATNFTTLALDAVPFDLQTADVTATTATLNWDGVQDSYNVQYRTAEVTEDIYFNNFNSGYDALKEEGWNWEENIIYGLEDPVYNIPGDENYFLPMGWSKTEEATIISPELPEYESGAVVEFHHFYFSSPNTFQIGYSSTTNEIESFTWSDPIDAGEGFYTTKYSEVLPDGVKYVAFKATASGRSECVFIDNFRIFKVLEEAGEWISSTADEATLTITGLTPDTEYEWQVQGNLTEGTTEWSEPATFTTNAFIELADNATDNSDIITDYAGKVADVTLTGRTLYKDGKWNTICLPFDVDIEGSVLEGAIARTLTLENGASISGSTLCLNFDDPVTTLTAGTPYLIRWTDGENIVNPVFNGVTIDATDNSFDIGSGETRVSFLGTYDALSFSDGDNESVLLMGGNNELRYANAKAGLGACRSYFKIGDDSHAARRLTAFHTNLDDETTGIRSIENGPLTKDNDDAWYSLDGRRLEGKPALKGVYINKGHKITIK